MTGSESNLVIGISLPQETPDVGDLLQKSREDGFDFVTTVLPHSPAEPIRSDVTALTGRWWRTSVVGTVPPAVSPSDFSSKLEKQVEWAMHMGIPAVILPPPPAGTLMDYARMIQSTALKAQSCNLQIWIKTGLKETSISEFDLLHRFCGGISNLGMILEMEPIPTMNSAAATVASQLVLIHKAIGMQLKAVSFPSKVFLTNKKGYPTMAKSHQVLFTEILKRIGRTVRVLVEGPSAHPDVDTAGATKCLPYLQYIKHVRAREDIKGFLNTEEAS
ncbi:MAG: hypothetical protein SGARI_003162, partial [Bacillariaceae sp.]